MPDCKETSAQVPLYNEIQATTTFASLALFFFYVLFTEITGRRSDDHREPSPRQGRGQVLRRGSRDRCARHFQGWGIPPRHAASSA